MLIREVITPGGKKKGRKGVGREEKESWKLVLAGKGGESRAEERSTAVMNLDSRTLIFLDWGWSPSIEASSILLRRLVSKINFCGC